MERVWLDEHELKPGDSLHSSIGGALEASDRLIVGTSKDSLKSRWVEKELGVFFSREDSEGGSLVIPVLLDDCQPTGFLRDRLYVSWQPNETVAVAEIVGAIDRSRPVLCFGLDYTRPFEFDSQHLMQLLSYIRAETVNRSCCSMPTHSSPHSSGSWSTSRTWVVERCAITSSTFYNGIPASRTTLV